MQMSEGLPYRISTKYGKIYATQKNSIHGFMQTRLDYGSMWNYPITVDASAPYRILTNVWCHLRATANRPFMSSCKVGFVMDQYG